jgi:hypothetical protein
MAKAVAIRIKKTPNCLHRYTATIKAVGTYGFGNTAAEARASLLSQLRKSGQLRTVLAFPGDADLELK